MLGQRESKESSRRAAAKQEEEDRVHTCRFLCPVNVCINFCDSFKWGGWLYYYYYCCCGCCCFWYICAMWTAQQQTTTTTTDNETERYVNGTDHVARFLQTNRINSTASPSCVFCFIVIFRRWGEWIKLIEKWTTTGGWMDKSPLSHRWTEGEYCGALGGLVWWSQLSGQIKRTKTWTDVWYVSKCFIKTTNQK